VTAGAANLGLLRLLISCPDRPGIVARVSRFLYEAGANIVRSDQYSTDPEGGTFFLRMEFALAYDKREGLAERFGLKVAEPLGMTWRLWDAARPKRISVMVSRYDHCLLDLLWRWRRGQLDAQIAMVISNHPDLREDAGLFEVKLVGATAHYVTEELDAGPIIEQDVMRVTHRDDADALAHLGADVERLVLARAVQAHCEDRVLRHGNTTVVF
jgi:formyltetrahydrofolate deformylase